MGRGRASISGGRRRSGFEASLNSEWCAFCEGSLIFMLRKRTCVMGRPTSL
jgi:hypothetical protein